VLGAVALHAALRGEFKAVYEWQEEAADSGAADSAAGAGADGGSGAAAANKKAE
jgi:hypothetical protein